MSGRVSSTRAIVLLLLVAIGIRLLGVAVLDWKTDTLTKNFETAAASEQAAMARGLLQSGDFTYFVADGKPTPSAYQPPLYPMLLAGVFAVSPSVKVAFILVQVLQSLVGGLIVWLVYRLSATLVGERAALWAGWISAFWPALVYMPNEAHSISIFIAAILAICWLSVAVSRPGANIRTFILLGAAYAVGLALRSEMMLPLLITIIVLIVKHRGAALRGSAILLGFAALVMVPWILRNEHSLGKAVLTTTTGVNLFRGNGPTATGGSYQWNGEIVWDTPQTLSAARALPWSKDYELKLDQIYSDAFKESLREDPLRPVKLLPAKFGFYWTSDFTHPKGKQPLAWLPWIAMLPFTLWGMRLLWKQRGETWPLYLWTMVYLFLVLVFFALPRYRLNVEPLFIIFASAALAELGNRRERKDLAH